MKRIIFCCLLPALLFACSSGQNRTTENQKNKELTQELSNLTTTIVQLADTMKKRAKSRTAKGIKDVDKELKNLTAELEKTGTTAENKAFSIISSTLKELNITVKRINATLVEEKDEKAPK